MGTVTITATPFTVYGLTDALAEAKAYLLASVGPGPDAWNALATDDAKAKFIVEAYRLLERQSWDATTAGTFAVRGAIAAIIQGGPALFAHAQYELAALLAADASVKTAATTGSNVKAVNAKGVSVEFFRATDGLVTATKLPSSIMDLVGRYLASATVAAGVNQAFNTSSGSFDDCQGSSFDDGASFGRKESF